MKNAIPYASGIITATAQTIAEIILAIIIDASGLPMEISEDIPTSMITDSASTSSMNGQIKTIRSSDLRQDPDLRQIRNQKVQSSKRTRNVNYYQRWKPEPPQYLLRAINW